MSPSRFSSVRQKGRVAGVGAKPSFRDDTHLVSVRYEKTKQAEPPIPLPPAKSSLRSSSSLTISRSNTNATNASRSTRPSSVASSSCHNGSVVVVAPPTSAIMPGVAPPSEQHPALRSPLPASALAIKDGKRDSGHAAASTSASTIHEEDCEDEDDFEMHGVDNEKQQRQQHKFMSNKLKYEVQVPEPAAVERVENWDGKGRALGETVDLEQTNRAITTSAVAGPVPVPVPVPASAAANPPLSQSDNINTRRSHTLKTPPSSPSSRKIAKRPSFRLSGLRSRKSSEASESTGEAPPPPSPMVPVVPLMRGSLSTTPASSMQMHNDTHLAAPLPPSSSGGTSDSTTTSTDPDPAAHFAPLAISIPTESLLDDAFMTGFSFSKRGSLMFGGKRATMPPHDGANRDDFSPPPPPPAVDDNGDNTAELSPPWLVQTLSNGHDAKRASSTMMVPDAVAHTPPPSAKALLHHQTPPYIRVLSPDIEKESQKVRSLYETSDAMNWEDGARFSFCEHLEPTPEVPAEEDSHDPNRDVNLGSASAGPRSVSSFSHYPDSVRRETELAGGLEDWEDVDGADVDRYGFIAPPRLPTSRISTPTELKSAQFSPRRRHVLHKRDPMGFSSQLGGSRVPSRKVSARSLNTVNSEVSVASMRSSRSVIRQATNLLPHNRNRRWMDEAGDMLTISPNLQDSVEEAQVEKISEALKRKEWERSEKWRKMAKVIKHGEQGEGMEFEFDVRNPKLVERTWKGIPDRWRGAAWWSFLATAAKEHKDAPSAEDIVQSFHQLQERSSPDDMQIDLDVPRTISRHIMFRRRYRGGQRLLFRVLHALSIYFPETGYVQGMASLAATLLCYFDEEKAFVMLVRMWQLRGLERLYRPPDFQGLMTALREFDGTWLSKAVSDKLIELGIDTTAYGTKWYLTLFNLSIPFAAQLRVWDVFLLLGDSFKDAEAPAPPITASTTSKPSTPANKETTAPASGLDVLHAASAALIEALREVLLDSDFENVMKALTSWIPIKDEDLLMKVTKAQWKTHQGKKRT